MSFEAYSKKLQHHVKKQNIKGVDKYINKINKVIGGAGGRELLQGDENIITIEQKQITVNNVNYGTELIGEGTFGKVYKINNTDVVFKVFEKLTDMNKIIKNYLDVGKTLNIPTIEICRAVNVDEIEILFMMNAGIPFRQFVREIKAGDITCAVKKNIRNMLKNFIDDIIRLNDKYMHTDLKMENVMFKNINGQWTIVLIDLDYLCPYDKVLESKLPSTPGSTVSAEFYAYHHRKYSDGREGNDLPIDAETVECLTTKNKKINFLGIINIIIQIMVLEEKKYFFIDKILNEDLVSLIFKLPKICHKWNRSAGHSIYTTKNIIAFTVYISMFYKYAKPIEKEMVSAYKDSDKIMELSEKIIIEVLKDKHIPDKIKCGEDPLLDLKKRIFRNVDIIFFVYVINNYFIPSLYNLANDPDEDKYVDTFIKKRLGGNNPVKKKKIDYIMDLLGIMYEIDFKKRDYDKVKDLIDKIYGIKPGK